MLANVMAADPTSLSPRKRVLQQEVRRSHDVITRLEEDAKVAEETAENEVKSLALLLASDRRELDHLRNQVSTLEEQLQRAGSHAVNAELQRALRTLAVQERVQAAVERRSLSVAELLQRTRAERSTDAVLRHRSEERAKRRFKEAETKLAAARKAAQAAELRAL